MSRAQRIWSEWALIAVALMVPLGAQALGLGEARVESFLNQPLDVRMRLLDATEDNLDSLTVAPASPEDYERLGMMGDALALDLEVRVDRSVSPAVIRITSDRVVTDPVVQLLIDARWSTGRMLREYTLFLDPATVEVEAPAPAPAQAQSGQAPATAPEPAPAARPSSPPARTRPAGEQPRTAASSGARTYGPVDSGETLWSIARAHLPSGEVTMNQMMIAIVELNPRAFRDRNINRLLRGAELRIPDAERAAALDAAAAAAEVAAQNRAFRRRATADTPVVSGAGRDGTSGAEEAASTDTPARASGQDDAAAAESADHRLSLVPPGDEESGSGLSDADASEISQLRQRLARAEEELYAARQEAEEFESRVDELETLVRDNAGGMGLRDAELARLQETLRAAREATSEDADPAMRARVSQRLDNYLDRYAAAPEAADAASDDAPAAATGRDDSSGADGQAAADSDGASAPDAAAAQDAPERTVTPVERSGGLLGNPILWLVVGLVLLLLVAAAVRTGLRRRAGAETSRPLGDTAVKPATDTETPLDRARARVDSRPAELAAHLGLLQTLATDGNEARFGDALEQMFEHVESGEEPEWREALELAGRVAPDHPLVKGSSDWVSDSDGPVSSEPVSEIDAESEVDDLMSRLDADLDESDDRDWLDDEAPEKTEPDAPLLRGDDESPLEDTSDAGEDADASGAESEIVSTTDDDAPIDFSEWGEADEGDISRDDGAATGREGNEEVGDLSLDWDDGEDDAGAGEAWETAGAEEAADTTSEDADDDIFAQSDDDIDVKLDLAKAYLSWNSTDSARTLLEEVVREGNEAQQEEARKLLDEAGDDGEG